MDPSACDYFTHGQRLAIQWGLRGVASLSLTGAVAMVSTFMAFPAMRAGPMRLVAVLSSVDICVSSIYIWASFDNGDQLCLDGNNPGNACIAQGMLLTFFPLSAVFWTACLAHNLYQLVVKVDLNYSKYFRIYHLLTWPSALIICLVNMNNMGWTGQWCWIREDKKIYFLTFYVPLISCWIFTCVVLAIGLRNVGKEGPIITMEITRKRDAVMRRRLMLILCLAFICWGVAIVNRTREFLGYQFSFAFTLAQTLTNPLTGALNALVYWQNAQVRAGCRRCCPCCRTGPEEVRLINAAAADGTINKSPKPVRSGGNTPSKESRSSLQSPGNFA